MDDISRTTAARSFSKMSTHWVDETHLAVTAVAPKCDSRGMMQIHFRSHTTTAPILFDNHRSPLGPRPGPKSESLGDG